MGLLLTVLAYVALVIVSILGLGLAMFTVAVLRLEHSLKDIPSPKKRSFFLGNLGGLRELKEKTGLSTAALLAHMGHDLGPVFWLRVFWTAHFIVLSAEVTKELLLNSRHTKPQIVYRGFQSLYGYRFMGHGLVSEIDHEKWFHRRAIMNPAFRRKYVMGFMDSFNEGAEMLCRQLLNKADDKTEVQMLDELNNVTLDVISKTSFSMDTDAVRDPNCPFPSAITTTLKGMQLFFDKPWIAYNPFSESRKMRRGVGEALKLIRETGRTRVTERIEARRKGEYVPNDILNVILDEAHDLEGDEEFQMENMLDEFVTLFIAGQETTSNLLAFTILQLGRNPDVYKKLQAEVDDILGDKPNIQYEDLAKLEYMMRVLKETLRLYPPVGGTTRMTAHQIKCKGFVIPAHSVVSIAGSVMSRMEEYFDDALLFNPDRFKPSEDGSLPRHLYAYFPFSMGQRSCIGQQFALIEARVILGKLLQRFSFRLEQSQRQALLDELTTKPLDRCKNYISLKA